MFKSTSALLLHCVAVENRGKHGLIFSVASNRKCGVHIQDAN